MTRVHVDLDRVLDADASTDPDRTTILGTRWHAIRDAGDRVLITDEVDWHLPGGEGIIELDPTPGGTGVRVRLKSGDRDTLDRVVAVPDTTEVVEFTSLEVLNPVTLDPEAEPEAAWAGALNTEIASREALDARVAEIEESGGAAVTDEVVAALVDAPATGGAIDQRIATGVAGKVDDDDLAAVATSGSYADLTDAPALDFATPTQLVGEAEARGTADAALDERITTETGARMADVSALQSAIDALPTSSDVAAVAQSTLDAIVAGAPAALDTLAEVAERIADGDDALAALTSVVGQKANDADLAPVAKSGAYGDLSNRPTLGTAAAKNVGEFATSTQGGKAETAVQPAALASGLAGKANRPGVASVLPLRAYGHSGLTDVAATQFLGYFNRARKQLGSISWNNLAVGGMMVEDVTAYALGTGTQSRQGTAENTASATTGAGTWVPSLLPGGTVVADAIGNNAFRDGTTANGGTTAKSRAGALNGLELLVRLLRAQSKREDSDASITYSGTWTTQTSTAASGGSTRYATAPGASATFTARNGDALVTTAFDASAVGLSSAAWSLTCDGQPYKTGTFNNGHRKTPSGTGAANVAIPIEGLPTGDHTFVFSHAGTSGQFLYLDCILRESPTPPTVILVKTTGATAAGYATFGGGAGPATDAIYDQIVDTVAAKFPADQSIVTVDPKQYGYDAAVHAGSDGIHASDAGAQLLADMVTSVVNGLVARPGLTRS